jgi:hypothetical protein
MSMLQKGLKVMESEQRGQVFYIVLDGVEAIGGLLPQLKLRFGV